MMRRALLVLLLAGSAGLLGCGAASSDFESGNRLVVSRVTDTGGRSVPIFNAVEETDDLGPDHQANTGEPEEDNNFPDAGETEISPLSEDVGVISLANQARLGSDPGVDLQVYRIDLSYYDALGNPRTFAPVKTYNVTGTVENDGSTDLSLVLVPVEMKAAPDGLRSIFLYGSSAERNAVRTWTVIVDVYARDIVNNRSVHSQGQTSIRFINPMIEQVTGP